LYYEADRGGGFKSVVAVTTFGDDGAAREGRTYPSKPKDLLSIPQVFGPHVLERSASGIIVLRIHGS
jgi:hypothetical protein